MDTHSTALRAPAHTTANYQAAIDAVKAYKESISLRTKAGEAYYEKTAERDHADRVLQAEGAKLAILMRKMWRLESYETIVLNDSSIRRTMDQARAEMQEAAEMEVEEVKATLHKHPHIESLGMTTKGGTDEENVILGTYAFVVAKACDAPEGKVSMHIVRMPNGMWVYHREVS
jgi:hypothetical protein